jgi:hypothetical protein
VAGLNITVLTDCGAPERLHGGLSAIDKCAVVLSLGGYLQRGTIVAKGVGEGMWECRRLRAIVPALEEWSETVPFFCPKTGKPLSWLSGFQPMAQRDYSAFGAARAFLETVGEAGALKACDEARARARNTRLRESPSASPLLAAIAALCGGCVPGDLHASWYAVVYAWCAVFTFWRALAHQRPRPWSSMEIQGAAVCGVLWPLFIGVCGSIVMVGVLKRRMP